MVLLDMSSSVIKVTRKGQITIPASYRKKYKIREGVRISFREDKGKLIIEPLTPIEDLAGIDAGKVRVSTAKKMLDRMRAEDRV
jgi:AbrB family looped-hinge helix DNA binding protein